MSADEMVGSFVEKLFEKSIIRAMRFGIEYSSCWVGHHL